MYSVPKQRSKQRRDVGWLVLVDDDLSTSGVVIGGPTERSPERHLLMGRHTESFKKIMCKRSKINSILPTSYFISAKPKKISARSARSIVL